MNNGYIDSPSNGVFRLIDSAATSFSRLQFGGTTSAYPAIKRNGAAINFRLADDSADAAITASVVTAYNGVVGTQYVVSGDAGLVGSSSRGGVKFPSDGVFTATNNAGTDFGRLQLGGTTDAFPSIKRIGSNVAIRLADDSNYTGLIALTGTFTGAVTSLRPVTVNTGTATPTSASHSGTLYTNTGDADGSQITLPDAPTVGTTFSAAVTVAQTQTIVATTGTLMFGTDTCAASLTSNSIGSTITLVAVVDGASEVWMATSHEGSWACND